MEKISTAAEREFMTITACNYVTQATRSLRTYFIKHAKTNGHADDAETIDSFVNKMQDVPHFVIPDDGRIIDDEFKGIRDCEITLPYETMTIEYFTNKPEKYDARAPCYAPKRLIYAQMVNLGKSTNLTAAQEKECQRTIETIGNKCILIIAFNEVSGMWIPVPMGVFVPSIWDEMKGVTHNIPPLVGKTSDYMNVRIVPFPWCLQYCKEVAKLGGVESLVHDISGEMAAVIELCEALSCSNVIAATIPKTNKKNKRKGNLRRYETKVLMIKTPVNIKSGPRNEDQTDRRGPRQHLRRGHVRRLPSGLKTWVTSCVVGSKKDGVIEKSYTVC